MPRDPSLRRFSIVPPRPYSLALTAERFARFPEVVDRFDGAVYRRFLPEAGGALLSVAQRGSPRGGGPLLAVTLRGPGARAPETMTAARRVIERSLGASRDVAAFYRAFRADPLLGAPIRRFRGLRAAGFPSLWEALVTAVLSQQVNLQLAYGIRRDLALAFGRQAHLEGDRWVAFPAPERIARASPGSLTGFRMSRAKIGTLLRLARAFDAGDLDEESLAAASDEEAVARLTAIQGIGRWTAEIALLRGLGRGDVFPAGDLGIVKYLAMGLLGRAERATEAHMRGFSERWRPHRGLALVYAYAELAWRSARA